jgi:hypothetical protein
LGTTTTQLEIDQSLIIQLTGAIRQKTKEQTKKRWRHDCDN